MLALIGLALADCDPAAALEDARGALGSLNLSGADGHLARAVEALECGRAPEGFLPELLTLEGVSAGLAGREADASERFGHARALGAPAPDFTPYGGAIAALWTDAVPPTGETALSLAPAPGARWRVEVDGERVTTWPVSVGAGAHLVQVLDGERRPHFARIVLGSPGQLVSVEHGLPDRPPAAVPDGSAQVHLTAGLGLDVASGSRDEIRIDGETIVEPSARVVTAVDVGLVVRLDPVWGRFTGGLGTLVGGRHLFTLGDEPGSARLVWGAEIGGGLRVGRLTPGLVAGVRLPSRARVRLVTGIALTDQVAIEPTVGVHVLTLGPAEPFAGVTLRVGSG